MKGVVLAGGFGTRLRPLTDVTNKHLLPVYDRPMIFFPLECLQMAGMDEVMVVTGGRHAGAVFTTLGDGKAFGFRRLAYAYQQGAGGIADALSLTEAFADGDDLCVILGDNVIEGNIRSAAERFQQQGGGAKILLKEVPDPERFGIAHLEEKGGERRIIEIIEKPKNPPGNLAVIGIYFYDSAVFGICRSLAPSGRKELEITDVNRAYLRRGELTFDILNGWWADAGTIKALHEASNLVAASGANRADCNTHEPLSPAKVQSH